MLKRLADFRAGTTLGFFKLTANHVKNPASGLFVHIAASKPFANVPLIMIDSRRVARVFEAR
jgi:hypothetical protein